MTDNVMHAGTNTDTIKRKSQFCASCGTCGYLERNVNLSICAKTCCPAEGINYPDLYKSHYGKYPESWLTGIVKNVRTGYASDPSVRLAGASGGVLTRVLQYLLESGRVDAVILARQGVPAPMEASAVIAKTPEEILSAAGSVYIPVPMVSALDRTESGKRYAMTCTPEQSAAIRALQHAGDENAKRIIFIVGPYTGTALEPEALSYYIKSNRIKSNDPVISVKWRAGKWPGYLEIKTAGGRTLQSPKVYYNFLIPFFVTSTSLLSMDFCNEFADLSVGDAWSPKYENANNGGVSVVVTRTDAMETIIREMQTAGLLTLTEVDPIKAGDMHGHMLDFKKRGGYIRCRMRRLFGMKSPDYGYSPEHIPVSRIIVECIISGIFLLCRTSAARWLICLVPEGILGPLFNKMRLAWKSISRPTKRKGLSEYKVRIHEHH